MKRLILHLGGTLSTRANKCIELAKQYPDTPILVSSEGGDIMKYYTERGIDSSRVFIDTLAWDTVTNFTSTFDRVKNEFKADIVHIVTNDFHMQRSMIIAEAVYWRTGIIPIASSAGLPNHSEKSDLIIGDAIRAWIWRLTGLLFYWKLVREKRVGTGYIKKWNEIGL